MSNPLIKEVKNENVKKVKSLLESNNDVNIIDPKSQQSLLHFCVDNQNEEILEMLLKAGNCDVDIKNGDGLTALMLALQLNWSQGVQLLVSSKASLRITDEKGQTALHFACMVRNEEIIDYLIQRGANPLSVCNLGSPLHVCILQNQLENALHLLDTKNYDFSQVDNDGNTILHLVIQMGAADVFQRIIQILKENNDKNYLREIINKKNSNNDTPLHFTSKFKRNLYFDLLISNKDHFGLDPTQKNGEGQTPEDIKIQMQEQFIKEQKDAEVRKRQNKIEQRERNKQYREEEKEQAILDEEYERQLDEQLKSEQEKNQKLLKISQFLFVAFLIFCFYMIYLAVDNSIQSKSKIKKSL